VVVVDLPWTICRSADLPISRSLDLPERSLAILSGDREITTTTTSGGRVDRGSAPAFESVPCGISVGGVASLGVMRSSIASVVGILLTLAACGGGGGDTPSCQQAFTHYYESGCRYFDLDSGAEIPLGTMVGECRNILETAPQSCQGEVDDWLVCLDGVPDDANSNADCDCSSEQESLLTCD
jgi:hypothetical protein